jgi:hypothetical protein
MTVAKKPASIKKLLQSAEKGDIGAQFELARRLREGNGVPANFEAAMHWYHKAAEAGNADAMNDLGSMILNGIGCDADPELAVPWFQEAADKGNAVAQFNLGLRYLHGDGVTQDDRMAGYWIAQAAQQDHIEALGELGTLYRFGRGTERNLVQACELHLKAAKLGDSVAHGNLSDYEEELVEMALTGNRQVAIALSRMYGHGLGVARDQAREWAWLRWAHDGCDPMPEGEAWAKEIDRDVADAFRFYLCTLDEDLRIAGEAWLVDRLSEAGSFGIHLARPLLVALAEGGDVELKGRWRPGGWWFFHESVSDSWMHDVDEASESADGSAKSEDQPEQTVFIERADSWEEAIALMDRHPWHKFAPKYVHPELGNRVWAAYQHRWQTDGHGKEPYRSRWFEACCRTTQVPLEPAPAFPTKSLDEIRRQVLEEYSGLTIEQMEAWGW